MKKFIEHTYDDIGRIYNFDDGSKYYSVTTALGVTKDGTFLEEWRKKVGEERAEAVTRLACSIGTDMHEILEYYLKNEEMDSPPSKYSQNLANQITPFIDKRVSRVHQVETVVYSDRFKLAGTADAIVTYANHLTVLDFKTAKRMPKIEWIYDYLCQLAIYAMMLEEMSGTKFHYGALLFAYKQVKNPNREIFVKLDKYKPKAVKRIEMFYEKIA